MPPGVFVPSTAHSVSVLGASERLPVLPLLKIAGSLPQTLNVILEKP
jgi:hypothetical protein